MRAALLASALLSSLMGQSGGVVGATAPPVAATFVAHVVPVGAGAWSVASGDVDGDGVLDLVTANKDADGVSVALGNGDGTFAAHVEYGTGGTPLSVAMGDLDGDGDLDLATADQGSLTVSVLRGNGDGTFAPAAGLALDAFPSDVSTGDVDADGDLDLAVATSGVGGTRGVSVMLGNGDGTFVEPQTAHALDGGSADVVLADVDGDAALDLISADGSPHTVSVLLGDGAGGFSLHASLATHATLIGPSSVVAADVDVDGDLDLLTANRYHSVSVLLGHGDGGFAAPVSYNAGFEPTDVVVADLNGDTYADLAVADVVRGPTVLLGAGDGTFGSPTVDSSAAGFPGLALATGDLNGDAFPDLAVVRDSLRVLVNTTGLTLAAPTATAASTGVTLSWSPPVAVATVTGYVVTPYSGPSPLAPHTFGSTATTQAIPGLTNGVTYTFKIAATNVLGAGPLSASSNAVLQATGLLAPAIGSATATGGAATVSWTAPAADGGSPVTGYVVTPYVGFFPLAPRSFSSTTTTQTVTGLTNGTEYRFRVQATNAFGLSGYSKVTNPVTPATTVPGAPTITRDATAGDGVATVSWAAPVSDGGSPIVGNVVTPYIGFFPLASTTFNSTATTQTVTGLSNGTTYRFRVQAINAVGTSPYSTVTNPVTPTA